METPSTEGARAVATRHLVRIEEQGSFSGRLGIPDSLEARDRRLVTELVAGVTRWRRWLDFVIEHSAGRPVRRFEPMLRQILRIGAYEILEQSTPDYAAVNESVELAKNFIRPGAGRLVNAVLRKVVAASGTVPEPEGPATTRMAIRYSHPDWMVRRWYERFGEEETLSLLQWNNRRPGYSLRVNLSRIETGELLRRLEESNIACSLSAYLDDFVRVDSIQSVLNAGFVTKGFVAVQDESAGLAVRVLDPRQGETVVDACAAPGGKLAYCCGRMQQTGHLIAVDESEPRLRMARRGLEALGCSTVDYRQGDAVRLEDILGGIHPDRVLVDAPCTGFGVLAKRPDLRWRRQPSDIPELTVLQDRLLDAAASVLKPGGLIVYSTCTIEPVENEDRITDFLDRHEDFRIESAAPFVPDELVAGPGFCAALPQRHGIDGAFVARLRSTA